MKVHVAVLQEDIDNGQPEDECCCPIARALKRATGQQFWVGAHEVFGTLLDENDQCGEDVHGGQFGSMVACLPPVAQYFIDNFDARSAGAVRDLPLPFAFDLEIDLEPAS